MYAGNLVMVLVGESS